MLLEIRTYTIRGGQLAAYLRGYEAQALPIQMRHLERLIGYFVPETGTLNQVVHLWAYDDMTDRSRRLAAMKADPGWAAVGAALGGHVERLESQLLNPTAFSPMQWAAWPIGLTPVQASADGAG